MTILNDNQITELATQENMITPFSPVKVDGNGILSYGLEPFGYTLTIADKPYTRFDRLPIGGITYAGVDTLPEITERPHYMNGKMYVQVPANEVVMVVVNERLEIPVDVQGQFLIKSSLARYGLFCNVTWIDAGWHGHLTVEIANLGKNVINIPVDEGVGQMVFYRGKAPNKAYSGRYQNQHDMVQTAIT
jgi:deoxycytidine triphosphate deaminase